MAKLILSMDGLLIKEIPLIKERITIGRKPHNDIQIDNLAISGEHAAVVTILDDAFLEDLQSTNGTLVNGQPVKKHVLKDGDVIELGKYRLKYLSDHPAPAIGPADFERTMVLRPGALRPPPPAPAAPTAAPYAIPATVTSAPEQPLPAIIQVLSGSNTGRELALTKSLTSLGRPGVQVAVISRRPQGYFLTHVEGERLPVLNGQTLDKQAHPLADNDVIEIAGVKMAFFLKP